MRGDPDRSCHPVLLCVGLTRVSCWYPQRLEPPHGKVMVYFKLNYHPTSPNCRPLFQHRDACLTLNNQSNPASWGVSPGVHRRSSSVTMSTPLMRFSQNSSRLLDSGKRPDIPAMTISSMLNHCEQRERDMSTIWVVHILYTLRWMWSIQHQLIQSGTNQVLNSTWHFLY